MSDMTSSYLTLNSLPCDVIRNIIRSANVGDNKDNLRLISRSWNAQVVLYLTTLPSVEWACFLERSSILHGLLHFDRRYLGHFLSVCPDTEIDTDMPRSLASVGFAMPIEDANQFFCRFFKSTNHIQHLSIRKFDKKTVECMADFMGTIRIELLEVIVAHAKLWQDDFRKIIMKIVRKNRIDTLVMEVQDHIISERELRKLISTIPQTVLHISITFAWNAAMLTKESKQLWRAYAKDTMKKKTKVKTIVLKGGSEQICNEVDPIFEFMRIFGRAKADF